MVASAFLIWKFEGPKKSKTQRRDDLQETVGSVYKDDAWVTSLKTIRPVWLLAYRITAFILLLALLTTNVVLDGGGIFFFYTQWTFTLVTIYFGLASAFSICGCCHCCYNSGSNGVDSATSDAEQGTPILEKNANTQNMSKGLNSHVEYVEPIVHRVASTWGYGFQIIYQAIFSILILCKLMASSSAILWGFVPCLVKPAENVYRDSTCAGAVTLTDCVFWFVIYPFLTSDDYRLNFMDVCLHSLNAVFLLGDAVLNSLRFPFFRISYFILWTGAFVTFQWILHACVSMWWPYSFLDLSSPYAPIWYEYTIPYSYEYVQAELFIQATCLFRWDVCPCGWYYSWKLCQWYVAVGSMHLPCYGIFALVVRMKHFCLSRLFPDAF
ncbi:unnamed protein product [Thlaspi arvense]|uniref:Transmembrane protein n=1 Tax=Thlaspi arvense TaxID=13288 RepID=A0AAU9T7W7_THLAR|nr:unnamed protein product [Thlaspi arvense]